MNDFVPPGLGETWLNLVQKTVQSGTPLKDEGLELLGVRVDFPAVTDGDEVLMRFGDHRMIEAMDRVFFGGGDTGLGHSYARLLRGPEGRSDLSDVIALLRAEPESTRAVVTFCGEGGGRVPCVNVVEFLVRAGALQTLYFARGQDAYKKFYADALCLAKMARRVAAGVGCPAGMVTGFIGSSHVYHADQTAITEFLARAQWFLQRPVRSPQPA